MLYQSIENNFDFAYDYAVFKKNDTTYTLNFYYEIPHLNLFFLKNREQFVNRYQVSLQLMDKKELIAGQLFTRTIQVSTYELTRQQKLKTIDSFNFVFNLKNKRNDKLNALLKVNDLHSTNSQDYQFSVELPLNLSRILFFTNHTINPKHAFPFIMSSSDTLRFVLEIYHPSVTYCSLWFDKQVETSTRHPSFRKSKNIQPVTVMRNDFRFNHYPDSDLHIPKTLDCSFILNELTDFGSGDYQVKITGYNLDHQKIFDTQALFTLGTAKFQNDQDYYSMVDKLVYLTTEQEMKKLKTIPSAERESTWHAFWQQYDPTPTTEINEQEIEYFEKIEYCVENFSKGDNGYRSHRAQVYMKYGLADYIESRPFERYANPSEIWYYYTYGKKYVFVDYHGFGEYILYEETRI
jgi:GWxTD domain-containing protein